MMKLRVFRKLFLMKNAGWQGYELLVEKQITGDRGIRS